MPRSRTVVAFACFVACDLGWLLSFPLVHGAWKWPALLLATGAQVWFLWAQHRNPAISTRTVAVVCGVAAMAMLVLPPQTSHDVWSYAMYGRIVGVHGVSPYTHTPASFRHDPLFHLVDPVWRHTPSVYGPLFNGVSGLGARVYGSSALAARLFYQGLAALAFLGAVALLIRRGVGAGVIAMVMLVPTMLVAVNGAHNDVVVGFGVLLALLLIRDDRLLLAGVVLGAATLVKLVGAPVAGGAVLGLFVARRWRDSARLGVPFAATVVVGYLLAGGRDALHPLAHAATQESRASIITGAHELVVATIGLRSLPAIDDQLLMSRVCAVVGVLGIVLYAVLRRKSPDPVEFGIAALTIYLLTAPYVLPWYPAALLPALALAPRRLRLVGFLHVITLQVAYLAATQAEYARVRFSITAPKVESAIEVGLLIALFIGAGRHADASRPPGPGQDSAAWSASTTTREAGTASVAPRRSSTPTIP